MYKNRFNGRSREDSHNERQYNGNRNPGGFAKRKRKKQIDPNLFINRSAIEEVEEIYQPRYTFEDFPINSEIKKNISIKGYEIPTPIQDQTIPQILSGRDVIGIANTGTGKTAAFLIPLVDKTHKDVNQKVLIVAPTRELAVQIEQELRGFAHGMGIHTAVLIGGASMHNQIIQLHQKPQFVIGTPGRIKDLIEQRHLDLSGFTAVVLDEVDRMLDIGFIKDIRYIISLLPHSRQSLFFSATVTGQAAVIVQEFLTNPVTISLKRHETAQNIHQDIIKVTSPTQKFDKLYDLLMQPEYQKVIIFGRTKWGVEKLTKNLQYRGFKAAAIHGNKTQGQRLRAIEEFKKDNVHILLATDIASRGLDIEHVTHVINFDAPESYDDYVHRIGRTGRAGNIGKAITFVE